MGNAIDTAVNTTVQSSVNNLFQSAQNVCSTNCNATNENINLVFLNSTVGNVNITAQCQADSLCDMRTNLTQLATQQLDATQRASTQNNGANPMSWSGFSINTSVNTLTQSLENTSTQIINNVCSGTSDSINQNVNVYAQGSTVAGITISASGSALANCTIQNSASQTVNQSEVGQQTASSTNGSVAAIIAIIVAIVVVTVIVAFFNYSANQQKQQQQQGQLQQLTQAKLPSTQGVVNALTGTKPATKT